MGDNAINDTDNSYSFDVRRVSRSQDQDGHRAHIW